jgi:HSP20 family protein
MAETTVQVREEAKPATRETTRSDDRYIAPPVDIYENEHAIVLEADVPGLSLDDLDIRVENNTLTMRGERKQITDVKEENCHRVERFYGAFSRSFTIPNLVDTQKIKASYDKGVLRVEMAKREETKPKQIRIEVTGEKQQAVKAS